jgi:ribosome small subunit-dependent GTPase A
MGARKSLGNAVVVGDRVRVARDGGRVVVEEVEPRRNTFSRRATGEKPVEQVIAANLDQIVVVASVAEPEFRPGFVDRVLSQAEHSGIPARLVLNKSDLGRHEETLAIIEDYRVAGYPGHEVCAKRGDGVEGLHHACLARRSLFIGHSGVGKSTLLETLVPDAVLKSGTVNPKTGKGRHTTTAAILLRPEPGFELIDTPGVRGFGLWGIGGSRTWNSVRTWARADSATAATRTSPAARCAPRWTRVWCRAGASSRSRSCARSSSWKSATWERARAAADCRKSSAPRRRDVRPPCVMLPP